jgi:hypothetical protein
MVTYIIPPERDWWQSKNVEDWIIRSEATYFDPPFRKVEPNKNY